MCAVTPIAAQSDFFNRNCNFGNMEFNQFFLNCGRYGGFLPIDGGQAILKGV